MAKIFELPDGRIGAKGGIRLRLKTKLLRLIFGSDLVMLNCNFNESRHIIITPDRNIIIEQSDLKGTLAEDFTLFLELQQKYK